MFLYILVLIPQVFSCNCLIGKHTIKINKHVEFNDSLTIPIEIEKGKILESQIYGLYYDITVKNNNSNMFMLSIPSYNSNQFCVTKCSDINDLLGTIFTGCYDFSNMNIFSVGYSIADLNIKVHYCYDTKPSSASIFLFFLFVFFVYIPIHILYYHQSN